MYLYQGPEKNAPACNPPSPRLAQRRQPKATPPPTHSNTHLHLQASMRVIVPDEQLIDGPGVHVAAAAIGAGDVEAREVGGAAAQLLGQGGDVVEVDVRVAHGVDQGGGDEVAGVGEHVGQQGVGGDVEGHAQAHVA